jgi:drug/metabolite transporter (DMT)-like permease
VRLAFAALAFALPFAIYTIYARFFSAKKHAPAPQMVWFAAIVLAFASFIAPAFFEPSGEGRLVPAHLENGVLVPDSVAP